MTSIITGDIIKSRKVKNPDVWLTTLKTALNTIVDNKSNWEIYRGDGFQIEIKEPKESFLIAMYIKACLKTIKGLDVRLAIGIGTVNFKGEKITESNGEAFQY